MKNKKLSIVIANINGWKYLEPLLESIKNSSTKFYEVIIVDNGSTENTVLIEQYCQKNKDFKLIKLNKNFGPATARNIGVANSNGEFIAFLDNDTLVDKNWAKNALDYFSAHKKVGVIQCKLLLESDHKKIDYVGEYLGSNGFLVQECPAGTEDAGQFNKTKKILAAKSAGMFIRRETFFKAGGFDDDYFIYVEETDLGWRSWIAGWEAYFLPTSIVYHHFGTSSVILGLDKASILAKFHGPKNYLTTLLKNLPSHLLGKIFVTHLLLWIGLIFYRLITLKFQDVYFMSKSLIYFFVTLGKTLSKRAVVQKGKQAEKQLFLKGLVVKRSLWYFINKAVKKSTVGNASSY